MNTQRPQLINDFSANEQGTVAMLFGLMASVLFFFAGMAIDYSRANDMKSRIVNAVDSASLAAGRALLDGKLNDAELVNLATNIFNENVKSVKKMGSIGAPSVKIDRTGGAIDIDVQADVKMTLARIGGFEKLDIPVTSSAVYQQKDIEVGMALDITGSMNDVVGGKRKIDALKSAFEKFADRLIPTQKSEAHRVRIGLAPYSAGVNVGQFAATVSQNRSKDGCVTERKNGQLSDAVAAAAPFLVKEDGQDDIDQTEGKNKNAFACPSPSLMPLSEDRDALVAAVNNFQAVGWTAGHLGIQWAWNIVSEQWGGTWGGDSVPDPYSRVQDDKLVKAVVLMTDGIFNTAYHGGNANNGNMSKTQAIGLCNAMKAAGKGVVVFAVAFNAPAEAQATLKACASSGQGYYVNASNSQELEDAFDSFANKLTELRLAK